MEQHRPRTRWQDSGAPRGNDYDARWRSLAASGQHIHGEADLVEGLLKQCGGSRLLDAGCGTGRVAIELADRGIQVLGVDADPAMIETARAKRPDLTWVQADLAEPGGFTAEPFDLVLLAGNVMIFLETGTERRVLDELTTHLLPGSGLLVAGFALKPHRLQLPTYDELAIAAGWTLVQRWATWDRAPYEGGDYVVSVHSRV
ncbi:MAG: class I SAM-dependent DNA methyltransferase [Mycobacterium sp.]